MAKEKTDKKVKKAKTKVQKTFITIGITIGSILGVAVLGAGSYVGYVCLQYDRVGDIDLKVNQSATIEYAPTNTNLTLTSFNIGFGAYSQDYTFFMDTGIEADGTVTNGHYGKAMSIADAKRNTKGCVDKIKELNSDFFTIQEVDIDSDRCYHINQRQEIFKAMPAYDETFAVNWNSAFLSYPLHDVHGKTLAGIQTLSKYKINKSERKEYIVTDAFPTKFFDLDRCFSVNYINVDNGKQLVLINSHMSAYDKGGTVRNDQVKQLNDFMISEREKGNYVVVGGDFNHDLLTNNPHREKAYKVGDKAFKEQYTQLDAAWINYIYNEEGKSPFAEGFTIDAAENMPSCRCCDVKYEPGHTFVCTVDGFICSNNVTMVELETFATASPESNMFSYSDHQPTRLTFKLNA